MQITTFDIGLEEGISVLNIVLAMILLWGTVYSQKRFGLAVYKRPWRLFICISILMIVGSALRLYLSLYSLYDMLWIPRALDAVERVLLIAGVYMLASIAADLWKVE